MTNRDLEIPRDSDYILNFEFLGANNTQFVFAAHDTLQMEFNNIKGDACECSCSADLFDSIDLTDYTNPVRITLTKELLEEFENNPIKYKLVLLREDTGIRLTLLTGYINLI